MTRIGDRLARLHQGGPGRPHARDLADRPWVGIVGGGIAGLAAAVGLAERGVPVVLWERGHYLGGRVGGWPTVLRDGTSVTMSRGFHAFFRQYYNLRGVLRRVDPHLDGFTGLPDYPLLHAGRISDSFARLPRVPPWNAAAFVAGSPSFTWRGLLDVDVPTALTLLDVSVPGIYHRMDHENAAAFLERMRFPLAARQLALNVFSRSFFAEPGRLSAAELAAMFHIYFMGSSEGLLFDVPTDAFPQALWDPLGEYLAHLGVRVCLGTSVEELRAGGRRRWVVTGAGGTRLAEVDALVLATDVAGLRAVVAASPDVGPAGWRQRIGQLNGAGPFAVLRLWLDRPVRPDRPGFLGTSGFGPLDNVSVLDRYERQAREWARRAHGSVVELHAYALTEPVDELRVRHELLQGLHRVYPETADTGIVDQRWELRADCPLFAPGSFANRPTVVGPDPTVVLAGDGVRVDLPVALMERAATTGLLAANALLAQWGLRGHDLWTVPLHGRCAPLRALTRRYARWPGQHPFVLRA